MISFRPLEGTGHKPFLVEFQEVCTVSYVPDLRHHPYSIRVICRKASTSVGAFRFPSVPAAQLTLDEDMDLMTKEGIRICSSHLFLNDLV